MHGLSLLWWVQELRLSAAVVGTALAAGDLAVTLFEIPTGWFADRFGHRRSLIVGSLVQTAAILCCWLWRSVPGLIAALLLIALGDGFRSGADQALLFRSCVALGRSEDFQKIEARATAVQHVALVGLVLAGGAVVAAWGFDVGWLAETVLSVVGVIIASAMVEPAASAASEHERDDENATAGAGPAGRWLMIAIAAVVLPVAFLNSINTAASFIVQTASGRTAQQVTVLVALVTLAEAGGALAAARLPGLGMRGSAVPMSGGAAAIAAGLVRPGALIPAIVGVAFLVGLMQPLRASAIQRLATDGIRAQAASAANACDRVCDTVALLCAGIWRKRH